MTMLALGSAIGGAFFLGSAVAIRSAGPAALLGFAVGGLVVYVVLMALADLTLEDPAPGSFRDYAQRAFGPLAGFVVGWVYWAGLALAMSSEATAAAVFLRTWWPEASGPVLATAIVLAVTGLNLLGARQLARLEGVLAGIKLLAVVGFILVAVSLIAGLWPGRAPVGWGALAREPWVAGGWRGLLGAMLVVMFTYAGTEVIGLAAPSARDPRPTVLRAARRTALALAGLYVAAVGSLLPLIPTERLDVSASPMVAALAAQGLGTTSRLVNAVLVTAILSTMLAVMFSLGRVLRSLAEDGMGPPWLVDRGSVPRRGIVFSGAAMLAGVALGYVVPRQVYVFLVSAGGFALLLVYGSIVAAHWRLRAAAAPRAGLVPAFPWSNALVLAVVLAVLAGMPLVPGQGAGLAAGLALTALAAGVYALRVRGGVWTTAGSRAARPRPAAARPRPSGDGAPAAARATAPTPAPSGAPGVPAGRHLAPAWELGREVAPPVGRSAPRLPATARAAQLAAEPDRSGSRATRAAAGTDSRTGGAAPGGGAEAVDGPGAAARDAGPPDRPRPTADPTAGPRAR
ncbi:MAG TPA: amino acid permease [Thermaerobacter sp.]